jgi:hypothetical protein
MMDESERSGRNRPWSNRDTIPALDWRDRSEMEVVKEKENSGIF